MNSLFKSGMLATLIVMASSLLPASVQAQGGCGSPDTCDTQAERAMSDYVIFENRFPNLDRARLITRLQEQSVPAPFNVGGVPSLYWVLVREQGNNMPPAPIQLPVNLPDLSKGGTIAIKFLITRPSAPVSPKVGADVEGRTLLSLFAKESGGARYTVLQVGESNNHIGLAYGSGKRMYWLPLWDPPPSELKDESWATIFLRFLPGSNNLQVDVFLSYGQGANVKYARYQSLLSNGFPVKTYPEGLAPKILERVDGAMLFGYDRKISTTVLDHIQELRFYNKALTEDEVQGVSFVRFANHFTFGQQARPCNTGQFLSYQIPVSELPMTTMCGPRMSPFPKFLRDPAPVPNSIQWVTGRSDKPERAMEYAESPVGGRDLIMLQPRTVPPMPRQLFRTTLLNSFGNNVIISHLGSRNCVPSYECVLTAVRVRDGVDVAYPEVARPGAAAQTWHYDYGSHTLRNLGNGEALLTEQDASGGLSMELPEKISDPAQATWHPYQGKTARGAATKLRKPAAVEHSGMSAEMDLDEDP